MRTSSMRPGNGSPANPIPMRSVSALATSEAVCVAVNRSTPFT
jgi:hypothetical protein